MNKTDSFWAFESELYMLPQSNMISVGKLYVFKDQAGQYSKLQHVYLFFVQYFIIRRNNSFLSASQTGDLWQNVMTIPSTSHLPNANVGNLIFHWLHNQTNKASEVNRWSHKRLWLTNIT